jgi:hypothetical protein
MSSTVCVKLGLAYVDLEMSLSKKIAEVFLILSTIGSAAACI